MMGQPRTTGVGFGGWGASPLVKAQSLIFGVVDDEEGRSAVVVLGEADGGRVLRQVDIHDDPAHLHHQENQTCSGVHLALAYCRSFWSVSLINFVVKTAAENK